MCIYLGGKSFSTELMLNQDGTLQSDITPKTWRVNLISMKTMPRHNNAIPGNRRNIKRYSIFGEKYQ